jgi:hypothetical protein
MIRYFDYSLKWFLPQLLGCKHALAVLGWLHRESEKKSVTEVKAYWKKSKLSRVGNTIKFVEAKSLCSRQKKNPGFLQPKSEKKLLPIVFIEKL